MLCAAASPLDHYFSFGENLYESDGRMGPHHRHGDAIRNWMQWRTSSNHKVLYDPAIGHRTQSSWDDHGETYPKTYQGPGLWIVVKVPSGIFRASLYFFNKDGHKRENRLRDYEIDVKPYVSNLDAALKSPILARARVRDFWGGVYKTFALRGPGRYWIHIRRNYSFNTIVSAIMLDKLYGPKTQADKYHVPMPDTNGKDYKPPYYKVYKDEEPDVLAASGLWKAIMQALPYRGTVRYMHAYRIFGCRILKMRCELHAWQRNWRWKMGLWTSADRRSYDDHMKSFLGDSQHK